MKISKIKLKNVKCFEDEELSFVKDESQEPLSVCALVGANGSGKSTILKAIVATFATMSKEYVGEKFGRDAIYWGQSELVVELDLRLNEFECSLLDGEQDMSLFYKHVDNEQGGKDNLYIPFLMRENAISEAEDDVSRNVQKYTNRLFDMAVSKQTGLVMYYDPFRFVSQNNPAGPNLQVEYGPKSYALASNITADGSNSYRDVRLKQWLVNVDYMRLKEPTERNQLIYNHIVKAFDMLLHPLKFENINQNGSLVCWDEVNRQYITIDMLSDGFKSIFSIVLDIIKRLALAPDFEGQDFYLKEAVVLIDEIDCHIHPKWQKKIIPALRELFPNCQFIVTTHSPYILDSIQEYEVRKIGKKEIV